MIHLGDITKIHGDKIEPVDCITFGSPCQDLSVAGKRAGLAGERSGLFMEAVRIIKEMRLSTDGLYPTFAIWENVPGAFSSNGGEDFRAVLEELAAAARRAGVPLWIKDSEEIRAVIGGEPAQALPDALKRPKDRPTPRCAECEHCVKTQEGQRGTRKECAIGWTAEGYEDGGTRHIPTRGNRQSPDWCPRRKDDAE
jgi:hypothetical protein